MTIAIPYFCTVWVRLQMQDLIEIDQMIKFKLLRHLFKNSSSKFEKAASVKIINLKMKNINIFVIIRKTLN